MSEKLYNVNFQLVMTSQWTKTIPEICVGFADIEIYRGPLISEKCFSWSSSDLPAGKYPITVQFCNKDYDEHRLYGKDMMVSIDRVCLEDINVDFSKYSRYQPSYPKTWYQEQEEIGRRPLPEIHANYLGWNGTWYLDIELPIFRWIHRTLDLGWLI